ncbi:MAG: non-hydrolyzing UDP-N-acetylglucosamine 2-epimerase [Candidatus Hinthialibacter sp.]
MPKTKLLTILGARPQFIKAAVVSRYIRTCDHINEIIVHTGQHYDHNMSQVFFDSMEIPEPHYHLGVKQPTHGAQTGRMLEAIEQVLIQEKPDWTLVYGDTNSTLAGALAAGKLHIPVAHVEAGLRSFNKRMPEEMNRVLTDHISDILFCPSNASKNQLQNEGITQGVHVIGDVMFDAFLHYKNKAIAPEIDYPFALATIHRAENTDDPNRLHTILNGFKQSPVPILFPVHPRTKKQIDQMGFHANENIMMIEPLSYFHLLGYLLRCSFVITDSGGLQKEAYFAGKRCITARNETEWTELIDSDANQLGGDLSNGVQDLYAWAMKPLSHEKNIYGDGNAAQRCVEILTN